MNIISLIVGLIFGVLLKWKLFDKKQSHIFRIILFLIALIVFNFIHSDLEKRVILNFVFGLIGGTLIMLFKEKS